MAFVFKKPSELYNALIDGPDVYNLDSETLVFHYTEDGGIAYYRLPIDEAVEIAESMDPDDGECLSGYLGPGGWSIDVDTIGSPKPCLEWLEDEYQGRWVTPSELRKEEKA